MSNAQSAPQPDRELTMQIRCFIAGAIFYNQKVANSIGLHVTDLQCINVLDVLGPLRPGALADLTGFTTGGITMVLDRLEKGRYIRRERNPKDRRSVLVHLVPRRVRSLDRHYGVIQRRMGEMLAGFSQVEIAAVLKFFKQSNAIRAADSSSKNR
jgi:MarR family transcriptional regulator, organic hydroperoxide resistance regulator